MLDWAGCFCLLWIVELVVSMWLFCSAWAGRRRLPVDEEEAYRTDLMGWSAQGWQPQAGNQRMPPGSSQPLRRLRQNRRATAGPKRSQRHEYRSFAFWIQGRSFFPCAE